MNSARFALLAGLVLATSRIAAAQDVPGEQFVIIPLRVHVLTSADIDQANCKMTEADAARVVGNINAIWRKAGIHFGVESILREPVVQRERFLIVAGLGGGQVGPNDLRILLPRACAPPTACTSISSTISRSTAPSWATTSCSPTSRPRSTRSTEGARTR